MGRRLLLLALAERLRLLPASCGITPADIALVREAAERAVL